MKYTEEEFYGNTQNMVLENGEVMPINSSGEGKETNSKVVLTIGITALKTMMILIGLMFYIISVAISLAPSFAIKIYEFVGADKVALSCYERIYEQDKSLANLYNVVQKSIQNKDYKKTSKYIRELQAKSDYLNFCVKVNKATLNVAEKHYIAYVGDLDGYLVSQSIMAEYNTNNKDKARDVALSDLVNTNIYSFGFSSFIECLENDDKLTREEVNLEILELIDRKVDDKSVFELIKTRRTLGDVSNSDGSLNDKILRVYACLKIEKVLYKNLSEFLSKR